VSNNCFDLIAEPGLCENTDSDESFEDEEQDDGLQDPEIEGGQ
jgi:hypothetical protein